MNAIDICTVSPGEIIGRVRNEHRPWTSGSPGCKDCGTNEPCAAQDAANEVLRLSRLSNVSADSSGDPGRDAATGGEKAVTYCKCGLEKGE